MRPTVRAAVVALAAVLVAVFATAGACGPDPCATLPAPSVAEQQQNDDIERTVGGTECDWEDGAWSADIDHASSHRTVRSTPRTTARSTTKAPPTTTKAPATTTRKR